MSDKIVMHPLAWDNLLNQLPLNTVHSGRELYGMPVIISEHAIRRETVEEKRTWKERLFSRPWKPLLKTKTKVIEHPIVCIIGDYKWEKSFSLLEIETGLMMLGSIKF